jgi:hypothetical protein
MRARRVRFTRPSIREGHPRAMKSRDGVAVIRRNLEGRHLKMEMIGEQRRKQESRCAKCGNWLELADAVFRDREFKDGIENPVQHRKCPANALTV